MSTPRDWRKYEQQIFKHLARQVGPDASIASDVRLPGRFSGVPRQIDIHARGRFLNIGEAELAVDCKYFRRRVDVKAVEMVAGLFDDVGTDFGLIITNIGFTPAAKARAKAVRGMRLEVLPFSDLPEWSLVRAIHEVAHMTLEQSTALGILQIACRALGQRGFRTAELGETEQVAAALSADVREMYATVMGTWATRSSHSAPGSIPAASDWQSVPAIPELQVDAKVRGDPLTGLRRYRDLQARADRLVPHDELSADLRPLAVSGALRCCLHPAGLAPLAKNLDLALLTVEQLSEALPAGGPDGRLRALEARRFDSDDWRAMLADLMPITAVTSEPTYTSASSSPGEPGPDPRGPDDVERRAYEMAARALTDIGLDTVPWEELGGLTSSIVSAVTAVDPSVVRTSGSAIGTADLVPRGRLRLRQSRLQLQLTSAAELRRLPGPFVSTFPGVGPHFWLVQLPRELLTRQFDTEADLGTDPTATGILSVDPRSAPTHVRFCPLSNAEVGILNSVDEVAMLELTTFACWRKLAGTVECASPVFVLIDVPLSEVIASTKGIGRPLRWSVVKPPEEYGFTVFVFADDTPSRTYFLFLASLGAGPEVCRAVAMLIGVAHDGNVAHQHLEHLAATLSHLVGMFDDLDLVVSGA